MQAENAADQMDWIEKITGVITSLLQAPEVVNIAKKLDNSSLFIFLFPIILLLVVSTIHLCVGSSV